jgi:glycosyltransferase involved in cell wall biosynthesis
MALLFDLNATQPHGSTFHGGGEYAKALFGALAAARPRGVLAAYRPDVWLDPDVDALAKQSGIPLIPFERGDLQALLDRTDVGAFYSALPYHYSQLDFQSVHLAYTVHGLRSIERPTDSDEGRYGPSAWVKAAAKRTFHRRYRAARAAQFAALLRAPARSRTVFVPSRHTKYALLTEFPFVRPDEVRVAYSPQKPVADEGTADTQEVLDRFGVRPKEYVLVVSGDRWIKNGLRAARALDCLFDRPDAGLPDALVLGVAAPGPYRTAIRNLDRFRFSDYVPPTDLEALYAGAFALLYPTLNEGFGYPPLEAMRHGTPVICSAVNSTTEVCGDSVLYVDPLSEAEMANRVLQLHLDPNLRTRLSAAGRKRATVVGAEQDQALHTVSSHLLDLASGVEPATDSIAEPVAL